MNQSEVGILVAVCLFGGMLFFLEAGRRIGLRRYKEDTDGVRAGLGVIEGALFGLLGLMIAFTFSGAASRFDERRELIVQEANAIGTAYLRLDVLPDDARLPLRALLRDYLDSRLKTYELLPDIDAAFRELGHSIEIQSRIWRSARIACEESKSQSATMLLLPALNEMFDIVTTRIMAARTHPPAIVFMLLGVLALTGALLAGFGMSGGRSRSLLHMVAFALIMASTVYVIFDLEYPRLGLFRVDDFDQVLVDLRATMN